MIIFCTIFALIIASVILVHAPADTDEAFARKVINGVNAVLVLTYVPIFELRQLWLQGVNYFKDINNLNDVLFLLSFILTLSFELAFGTTEQDSESYEATLILYALLLTTGFIKTLNTLRFHNNISFIVRMLGQVMLKLIPFLSLFMAMIIVFMFI